MIILIVLLFIFSFDIPKVHAENRINVPDIYIEDSILPLIFTNGNLYYENNGLIYVPVRQIAAYLGLSLRWNQELKIVEIDDTENNRNIALIDPTISNYNKLNNFKVIEGLQVNNGISYFPIQLLARCMGYELDIQKESIRLYPHDSKPRAKAMYNDTMPAPNPFTPFVDSNTYLMSSPHYSLDENGVLLYSYGSSYQGAGLQYNPSWISLYAFSLYRDYLKKHKTDQELKNAFLIQAEWLVNNRVDYEKFSVWEYEFDNLKFGAIAPWRSAMANGRVLSVMVKAYALTGHKKYLNVAERAYQAFLVETKDNGVATFLPDGSVFYEEVADVEAISSKILNGHIFALSGLYDYWQATGRRDVKISLDKGIKAIKKNIDKYDAGFLSYYSQEPSNPRIFAPRNGYNLLHVHQLLWLYSLTHDSTFLQAAMKFYGYEKQDYLLTAKGSTDPKGHGPENLNLTMGTNYWSHNDFPTYIRMDLKEIKAINGISIMGYTEKASPKDIDIWYSNNGDDWKLIQKIRGNSEKYKIISFLEPVHARFLKIDILNDNGNNNVALTGIGIITSELANIICDFNNFSAGNSPYKVIDDKTTTWFEIKTGGWLIINIQERPIHKIQLLTGIQRGRSVPISILGSNDLRSWAIVKNAILDSEEKTILLTETKDWGFLKIVFTGDLSRINEIIIQ